MFPAAQAHGATAPADLPEGRSNDPADPHADGNVAIRTETDGRLYALDKVKGPRTPLTIMIQDTFTTLAIEACCHSGAPPSSNAPLN